MRATCTTCDTTSAAIENTRCARAGCEIYFSRAGCEHRSFVCAVCSKRLCAEHKVTLDDLALCLRCALESVESQEPDCGCSQADVDLFDSRGCELHDPASPWNLRVQAVTLIRDHEVSAQSPTSTTEHEPERNCRVHTSHTFDFGRIKTVTLTMGHLRRDPSPIEGRNQTGERTSHETDCEVPDQ